MAQTNEKGIFGRISQDDTGPRFLPHNRSIDLAGPQNPAYSKIDPEEVRRLSLRTEKGLELAARNAFEDKNDQMSVAAAIFASREAEADSGAMGRTGMMASYLEKVALEKSNKPGATRLLTVAAAAHNLSARESAQIGFGANESVVEASALQKRNPLSVVSDLVQNDILDKSDPRAKLNRADVDIAKYTQQKESPSKDSPAVMLTQARQMEKKGMDLHHSGGHPEDVYRALSGSLAKESLRQDLAQQRAQTQTPQTKTPRANTRTDQR